VNHTSEPDFESANLSQRVHGEFKDEVIPIIAASVYTNASEIGLQALKESVKAWMPALFDHETVDDVEPYTCRHRLQREFRTDTSDNLPYGTTSLVREE
jgi:hypothetical protein